MESKKKFLINLLFVAAIIAVVVVVCRFALDALLPFLLAFVFAGALRPLFRILHYRLHVPKKLASVGLAILFFLIVGFLVTILGAKIVSWISAFISGIPDLWRNMILPAIESVGEWLKGILSHFNVNVDTSFQNILAELSGTITSVSTTLVTKMSGLVVSVPSLLISILLCIISTVFVLADWDNIRDFLLQQLPNHTGDVLIAAWNTFWKMVWRYIRSYGLIMLITFAELSIGLMILGVENYFGVSASIAVLDILPIVGCGTALIPWAVISFIIGRVKMGIGLLIVYVIITIVRNIIEPKIVSSHVGLHPVVTLISMVVGTAVFGAIGLFGLPIAVAVLRKLDEDGVIHILKHPEEEGSIAKKASMPTE